MHAAALAAGLQLIEDILALLLGQPMQGGLNVLLLPGLDALKARWQWQAGIELQKYLSCNPIWKPCRLPKPMKPQMHLLNLKMCILNMTIVKKYCTMYL